MSRGRSRLSLDELAGLYWPTERAERDLMPLALFKGPTTLGGIQGMWNLTQALRVSEVATTADAGRFVRDNPEVVHAAGLHPTESDKNGSGIGDKLWRMTNRVFSAQKGAQIDSATSEYLRWVMHNSRRMILTTVRPIDRYSPYSRVAWRRANPALVGLDRPVNDTWPFLSESTPPDLEGLDLLAAVDALVPSRLPKQLRDDVCQDVVLAVLEGEIKVEDLQTPGAPWLKEIFRRYRVKYGTISLDAPPPWDSSGRTLLETLAA